MSEIDEDRFGMTEVPLCIDCVHHERRNDADLCHAGKGYRHPIDGEILECVECNFCRYNGPCGLYGGMFQPRPPQP